MTIFGSFLICSPYSLLQRTKPSSYQDIEERNNDDKNKIKSDWSRQTPGLNAIGGTQFRPASQDSSEAILGVDQNTFSNECDRRANANSDNNLDKFNDSVPTFI